MARKILQLALVILFAAVLLSALIPLVCYGIVHTGVLALLLYSALIGGVLLFWNSPHPRRILLRRIGLGLCAGIFLIGGIFSVLLMHAAYGSSPVPGSQQTVLVLGCQVIDGRPSRMLRGRLERAAGYLLSHPDAPCIVSGGQGKNETTSEAQVMRAYLLEKGIDAARIYLEDQAENTRQNIAYCKDIISKQALPEDVVIVTDGYHQLRAQILARRDGLIPTALSSFVLPGLFPSYLVRELFAVLQTLFL